uniref:Protein MANBAL n=1 Tax=Pongo abelii TaxID=9601 RepID=A0A8I5T3J6_PONAB
MASDLDFSPLEVPEPTFLENLLWYGLFLGAIFQLICLLAIIIPIPKSHEVCLLLLPVHPPSLQFFHSLTRETSWGKCGE